ncbi:MAG: hypothetical protein ACI853_000897 [Paracoccaceae bacterium]|jgi:hypothetical protein
MPENEERAVSNLTARVFYLAIASPYRTGLFPFSTVNA